jgi:hypothetical protein
MKTYSNLCSADLARQLAAAGVLASGAQNGPITRPTPPGLLICQVGGVIESTVFDVDRGYGTGFIIHLHVAVDLSIIRIWRWELDLPWTDPQFQWIAEPTGEKFPLDMYQIPGCAALKYPKEQVINHVRVVRRGRCLDGTLVGFGFESIPDSYPHGTTIDANLVLIDEMGRGFSTPVQLFADRSAKFRREKAGKTLEDLKWKNQAIPENAFIQS